MTKTITDYEYIATAQLGLHLLEDLKNSRNDFDTATNPAEGKEYHDCIIYSANNKYSYVTEIKVRNYPLHVFENWYFEKKKISNVTNDAILIGGKPFFLAFFIDPKTNNVNDTCALWSLYNCVTTTSQVTAIKNYDRSGKKEISNKESLQKKDASQIKFQPKFTKIEEYRNFIIESMIEKYGQSEAEKIKAVKFDLNN